MTYFLNPIIGVASPKAITQKILMYAVMVYSLLGLLSCSAPTKNQPPRSTLRVISTASQAGFYLQRYQTHSFLLSAYEHLPPSPGEVVHVYIEGDGNSWKTKYRLSDNPTPRQPLALKLAILDPHSHVVYISRPCQYTPHDLDPKCSPKYWSSHRYAPEVIQAMNEVLTQIKEKTKNTNFVLIGFSGGASVACLVAAQRQDVSGLITIAGDLNHETLNQYHQTSPLAGSLNPIVIAPQLKNLPQHHWNGTNDRIVPTWIAQDFAKKVNNPACVQVHTLKGVSHHKGWEKQWKEIVSTPLRCSTTDEKVEPT